MSPEQRLQAQKELAQLESFLSSDLHKKYLVATSAAIDSVKERLCYDQLVTVEDALSHARLKGELSVLEASLDFFADARDRLQSALDADEDERTRIAINSKPLEEP